MTASVGEFLDRLAASEILPGHEVTAIRSECELDPAANGEKYVRRLVKQGRITGYQARALWKDKGRKLSFGNYVIEDELGRGGMGVVLKARHGRMQRHVAIKVLPAAMTKDADAIARFQREVVAASQLEHPNIVSAYDADEIDGQHILVMQFVDGKDLASVVDDGGPLSVDRTVDCVVQTARGLGYAHEKGIVHRDIKPANLLLDSTGTVKILDMGLARFDDTANVGTQANLTGTGTVMGTVDFMSPEQALDTRNADARSDVYSLGCTLYSLLTGRPLYGGDTLVARILAHRDEPIPPIHDVVPDVPADLDAVYRRMVAKQPDERPQSMEEVVSLLEACLVGVPAGSRGAAHDAPTVAASGGSSVVLDGDSTKAMPGPPSGTVPSPTVTHEVSNVLDETVVAGRSSSESAAGRQHRSRSVVLPAAIGGGVLLVVLLLAFAGPWGGGVSPSVEPTPAGGSGQRRGELEKNGPGEVGSEPDVPPKTFDGRFETTTWDVTDSDDDQYEITFEAGGRLLYRAGRGERVGTWKLAGDRLVLEMNEGFTTFDGGVEGNELRGSARNEAGHTWTWQARLK